MSTQNEKEIYDRLIAAVGLLGSDQTSVRAAAIYLLYQQAVECEKYRKQIVQILCSHIRSKTQEPEYQQQHKKRPSNEIQMAIDLLFRKTESKGLYLQFGQELPNANLSYVYCVGANFRAADCQGADFRDAYCQGSNFWGAQCQGADFVGAQCQGASFWQADCWGTQFFQAQCQGANFEVARCQGASFSQAHCQGANFEAARCQGASFLKAYCQGINFRDADCRGASASHNLHFYLENRIGKNTELEELILEGALSEKSVDAIEKAKEYCSSAWYSEMLGIVEGNKNKEKERGAPDGIISGVLEDSENLQEIIKELENIRKRKSKYW